jgi:signal transduction histidine kinase
MTPSQRAVAFVTTIVVIGDVAGVWLAGLPARHIVELSGYAGAGALLAGLAAGLVLLALRRRSVAAQAGLAALTPVLAVALGAAVAAKAMFIAGSDLRALSVILVAAGTVGVVEAALLGRRVAQAGRRLEVLARQIGADHINPEAREEQISDRWADSAGAPATTRGASELDALAAELAATSARLAESRRQAAALEQSRRDLIAWVSHDLRTPLAGIKAMVEALEDGVVDDEETVERYHRSIRLEIDQLATLVGDLFELSTIQAGSITAERRGTDVAELVSETVAGAAAAAAARGVQLELRPPATPVRAEVWPPSIIRAVRNLVDNAVRHTPAGCHVRVEVGTEPGTPKASTSGAPGAVTAATAAGDGATGVISVADQCGGLAPEIIERVFDAGFRGDTARTPGDGGAGLGLAIARGLVEAHGGAITVANADGGCAFAIHLPLTPTAAEDRAPDQASAGDQQGSADDRGLVDDRGPVDDQANRRDRQAASRSRTSSSRSTGSW